MYIKNYIIYTILYIINDLYVTLYSIYEIHIINVLNSIYK